MKRPESNQTALGIELGSTRIKAVLAGPGGAVLASGAHDWENRFEGGYWTYHLDDVWAGIQDACARLAADYKARYGETLRQVGALGVPVSVMETAGEGGPWGMALLALYRLEKQEGQTLEDWLDANVFAGAAGSTQTPDEADQAGCRLYP